MTHLTHVELQGVDSAVAALENNVGVRRRPVNINVATGDGSFPGHLEALFEREGTQPHGLHRSKPALLVFSQSISE